MEEDAASVYGYAMSKQSGRGVRPCRVRAPLESKSHSSEHRTAEQGLALVRFSAQLERP